MVSDAEEDMEVFVDAPEAVDATRSLDGPETKHMSEEEGTIMARSLSERTLALVAPAVEDAVATFVTIWVKVVTVLITSKRRANSRVDYTDHDSGDDEKELFYSFDDIFTRMPATPKPSQLCS